MYGWDSETAGSSLSQLWLLWSLGFNFDDVVLVLYIPKSDDPPLWEMLAFFRSKHHPIGFPPLGALETL